jgi:hypothetical protein
MTPPPQLHPRPPDRTAPSLPTPRPCHQCWLRLLRSRPVPGASLPLAPRSSAGQYDGPNPSLGPARPAPRHTSTACPTRPPPRARIRPTAPYESLRLGTTPSGLGPQLRPTSRLHHDPALRPRPVDIRPVPVHAHSWPEALHHWLLTRFFMAVASHPCHPAIPQRRPAPPASPSTSARDSQPSRRRRRLNHHTSACIHHTTLNAGSSGPKWEWITRTCSTPAVTLLHSTLPGPLHSPYHTRADPLSPDRPGPTQTDQTITPLFARPTRSLSRSRARRQVLRASRFANTDTRAPSLVRATRHSRGPGTASRHRGPDGAQVARVH